MRSRHDSPADISETYYRRALGVLLAAALVAGLVGLDWGLPNGNRTWAADSVAPMTPYSVAYHVFAEHGPNSGYFYFKYPVGHQLLLAAVGAPVLAWAALSGNLTAIATEYPFGMQDPEPVLTALQIAMRCLSVALSMGLLLAVAGTARRLASRRAGLLAGVAALGRYPLLFYQHTTNVEVPYLFWALVALYASVRAADRGADPRWMWLLGLAAAMAVSTKEQIVGFLVLLPAALLISNYARIRAGESGAVLMPRGWAGGLLISLGGYAVANAAFFNPAGTINRIRYLTHTLDTATRQAYAGYEMPIDFSTAWTVADELLHLDKAAAGVIASIGWPALCAALAGLVLMARRNPRGLLFVAAAMLGYYLVSLRLLKQVEIRYTMALSCLLAIPAGLLFAELWRRRGARLVVVALLGFGLVYSGDTLAMLARDARYATESWMEDRLAGGERVEVYQSWTYLPRWQRREGVRRIDFDDIGIVGVEARRPDLIVLSSKGMAGITMYPNPDWRDGRGMMLVDDKNRRFLDALESGELGYTETVRFERRPLIGRDLITSLNPAMRVFERRD